MRSDLEARYSIGEPSHENEFIVYPATDKRMGWSVAIVEPDLGLKADTERLQRAWASVNDAKSLPSLRFVEILDLIAPTDLDPNFHVVEKRPAKTLRQYVEEQEIIDFDRAVEIVRHILEGLATLHGAAYAHNALTDRCIYVSEDYSGLSVRIGNLHLISRIGEAIVPPYAPEFGAPDLYRPGTFNASPASDVYSAGMIAYKLFLPGRTYADVFQDVMVWEEEHQREQNWKNIHVDETKLFPRLDTLIPGFPAALATLVERMLSRDVAGRPRDATEALTEFRRSTQGISRRDSFPMPQPSPDPASLARKPAKRRWSGAKIAVFAVLALVAIGAGGFAVYKIVTPDPELVASVGEWQKAAETRRSMAVAAKAPERQSDDPARRDFDAGSEAMKGAASAVSEDKDYEAALAGYQKAVDDFGRSLAGIALADAEKSREAAKSAGGEKAPAFVAADKTMAEARQSVEAKEFREAVNRLNKAKTEFDGLATSLASLAEHRKNAAAKRESAKGAEPSADFAKATSDFDGAAAEAAKWNFAAATERFDAAGKSYDALAGALKAMLEAKKDAGAKREAAERVGASESPDFPKAASLLGDAENKAKQWEIKPADAGFREAAKGFDALIAEIMAAKGDAAKMKQKVADLDAALGKRAGVDEPTLVELAPRIKDADSRFAGEAYKIALASYDPILKRLEELQARGFCPSSKEPNFRQVAAGNYSLSNIRLMTSSLGEFGNMLGVVNGAAKVDKPFCMGTTLVTRADMAAFRAQGGGGEAAADGGSDAEQPADDVTWADAKAYAEWLSGRLGTTVRLPFAPEWMAGASGQPANASPTDNADGDIVLQWSATPCENGGYVAFLSQAGSTFAVCSDAEAGGIFRIIADLK